MSQVSNCQSMFDVQTYLLIISAPINQHLRNNIYFHSIKIITCDLRVYDSLVSQVIDQ